LAALEDVDISSFFAHQSPLRYSGKIRLSPQGDIQDGAESNVAKARRRH
jgi:hypothetical protein